MKEVFTGILNISISACFLIAVCILVRLFFKNMPKFVRCLMWLIVAVRLAVPFSIESSFSLLPAKEYVTIEKTEYIGENVCYTYMETATVPDNSETAEIYYAGDDDVREAAHFDKGMNKEASVDVMGILSYVWIAGVAAVLIYALIVYVKLRRMVSDAVILRENIYQSEKVGTAFVLGIISPKIYIPYHLSLNELFMVVNHERAHIRRRDHLVKPMGFILVAVYWFNPLVWLAYILLCRDIELACDEKVIKKIGYDKKKEYSQALLNLSVPRKYISACPVAFGELGVGERVKNVIRMKKGGRLILSAALMVCAVLALGFLTYPKKDAEESAMEKSIIVKPIELEGASESEIKSVNNGDPNEIYTDVPDKVYATILSPVLGEGVMEKNIVTTVDSTFIDTEDGTKVVSVQGGKVEDISSDENGGVITIINDKGRTYIYSYLNDSDIQVNIGEEVNAGDVISSVGWNQESE